MIATRYLSSVSKRLVIFSSALVALTLASGSGSQAQSRQALEVLNQRLLPLFELAGVVFTDADEGSGRLVVGVLDRGAEGLVRAQFARLGVPTESVDLVETDAIHPVVTLRDKVRPVVAGLQIRFSQYVCSLGFNATLGSTVGYVTASHCSTNQGSVDGTQYYQPLNQVPDEFIGTEVADPAFFRGNGCPRGRKCRYSDSNFSAGNSAVNFTLGEIARTTGANNGSLDNCRRVLDQRAGGGDGWTDRKQGRPHNRVDPRHSDSDVRQHGRVELEHRAPLPGFR